MDKPVDNSSHSERSKSDAMSTNPVETGKQLFQALGYQDKLKYIKAGSADNIELLTWIASTHKQTAIINAVNKRIALLQQPTEAVQE